jgi:hypothetical protein
VSDLVCEGVCQILAAGVCYGPADITSYKIVADGTLRDCEVDGPPAAEKVPEAISYYEKVEGNKYCLPWTDAGGSADGGASVADCEALCDADASCVAVSFFPDWGQNCYLFAVCDEQENATENGETFVKQLVSAPYSLSTPAQAVPTTDLALAAKSSKARAWEQGVTVGPIAAVAAATVLLLGLAKWVQLRSATAVGTDGVLGSVTVHGGVMMEVGPVSVNLDGADGGLVPGGVQAYL